VVRLYSEFETSLSRRYLREIFSCESSGVLLLGGWTVYLLVSSDFQKSTGRGYIGSRDIDIGFHLKEESTREDLKKSEFSRVIKRLINLGFRRQSFRLYKDFDAETHRELSIEEAQKRLPFEVSRLYVDLVVDRIPIGFQDVFGFTPIDEPLLELAFKEERFRHVSWEGIDLRIVEPSLLLGMKLNSVVSRTSDHKRVKDIADIYALVWHSGASLSDLKEEIETLIPVSRVRDVLTSFNQDNIEEVSSIIGVEASSISRVFTEFRR